MCQAQCTLDHLIGTTREVPALEACLAARCETPCGLECGALTDLALPTAAAECRSCQESASCTSGRACAASVDCQIDRRCRRNCATGECFGACDRANEAGALLYSAWFNEVRSGCGTECTVGGNWACIGKVKWPTAKSAVRSLTFTLLDYSSGQAFAGATIKLCQAIDLTCASPVDRGVTDERGMIRLVDATTGQQGGFGLTGYLDVQGPEMFPNIVFLVSPTSEPDGGFAMPLTVIPRKLFESALALVGVTADPKRGHVLVGAADCLLSPAPGMTFGASTIDSQTSFGFLIGGIPSLTATSTDPSGLGTYVNVPVGAVEVSATPISGGRPTSRANLFVREGTISAVAMPPTP